MSDTASHSPPARPDPAHPEQARSAQARPEALAALYGNEHPLVDIPFTATLDGRQYHGAGINLVEAHVTGLADPALDGEVRPARLSFAFHGFEVTLHPRVRVLRASDETLVLRFEDPSGEHLPQLRHLINEWIAGDLTSLGSVIRTGALAGPAKPKKGGERRGFGARLKTFLGTAVMLALTLALIGLAATLVRDRLLVTELPEPGRIAPEGRVLRAVADGQVSFLDPGAAEGEVAFAVAATGGETLSIGMPCDCTATPAVAEGDTVLAGDPVMRLSAEDAPLVVEASLPPEALLLLQEAGGAALGLPGGARVPATLDGPLPTGATDEALPVTLHPAEPLPPELSGRLARIRIERDPQAALGPVAGLWERGDAALGTAAATAESGAERAGAWWSDTVRPRLSSAFAPKETRQ